MEVAYRGLEGSGRSEVNGHPEEIEIARGRIRLARHEFGGMGLQWEKEDDKPHCMIVRGRYAERTNIGAKTFSLLRDRDRI